MHNRKTLKLLLNSAVPAAISMMVAALCNITDRWFIGESEGITALAGLSLTLPLTVLLTAIGAIPGTGAAILAARKLHKQEKAKAEEILGNAFILTIGLSLLTVIVLSGFQKEIVLLFGGREQTIFYASRYLNILIPGCIFLNMTAGPANCMRVCGFSRKVAFIILAGITLNILFDYLFVIIAGKGIEGSALATVLSMGISSFLIFLHFISPLSPLRLRLKYLFPTYRQARKIIFTGLTPFFMNLTICTVSIIMNNYLVIHGGTIAIGAYGIISSYTILIMTFVSGICQGMQITIRNHPELDKTFLLRIALYSGGLISCAGLISGEFFTENFIRPFTTNPDLIGLASTGLRIIFCTLPILGFQLIVASFFQSIDKTRKALFINMSRQFLFLIPSLFIFSGLWGMTGVWIAVPFADLLSSTVSGFFLRRENHVSQQFT